MAQLHGRREDGRSYALSIPYTSNGNGSISLALDGDAPIGHRSGFPRRTTRRTRSLGGSGTTGPSSRCNADFAAGGSACADAEDRANRNMNLDSIDFRLAAETARPVPPPPDRPPPGRRWTAQIIRLARRRVCGRAASSGRTTRSGLMGWPDRELVGGPFQQPGRYRSAWCRTVSAGSPTLRAMRPAWDALFRAFNQRAGRGDAGYRKGERSRSRSTRTTRPATPRRPRSTPRPSWFLRC